MRVRVRVCVYIYACPLAGVSEWHKMDSDRGDLL